MEKCHRKNDYSGNKKILHIGRFSTQKNHEVLVKAFSTIVNRGYDVSLYLYGQGELEESIKEQVNNLHLKNFLKQVVVDIVTIALMSSFMFLMPIKTLFTLSSISYISWVVLAIKVSIVSIIFICITNLICYKKYMIKLFGTISVILKKLLDAK